MKSLYLLAIFLIVSGTGFTLAAGKDSLNTSQSLLYEKLYLHTDRELYAPGDDIWMKSYLVSGINNRLIPGYKNIYFQLISDSGRVVLDKILLSKDGKAAGDVQIRQDMPDGTYTIRAYTRYLQNFGEESYSHKKIVIAGSKNSLELNMEDDLDNRQIALDFLPEGGSLVLNGINHVAFKAIDEKGRGVDVTGKVVDEKGEEVVAFQSRYKGMGTFMMMPQEGKSYFALLDGFPDFSYELEEAAPDAIAMNYKSDGNYLQITLTRNLKKQAPQGFLLKATHKGIDLFYSQVKMTGFQHAQRLFKGLFPPGISKITLLDSQNNVVAERLVFVKNNNDQAVQLKVNKDEYRSREKVKIDITSLLPEYDTVASLSLSVVNEDYLSSTGNTQNIESYLLLDSELKGSVESPASLFRDENGISADEKLDLVMMVNGWRSYYWDDLEFFRNRQLAGWDDYGLEIKGKVVKQWGGKPADEGKVVLGPFSSGLLFEETKTDLDGNFRFDRLYLKDNARIMINAQTKAGSKRTDIILEEQSLFDSTVSFGSLNTVCPGISVPMKFYRENYYRKISETEYLVKSGILLDEVKAVGNFISGDGHVRLYSEPDVSLVILEEDIDHYFNILDYLQGRVAGVDVVGEEIRIRGAMNNPLLLVDGIETSWSETSSIPMGDIDKIEILKSGYGMSVYGSRGGDGVISVLTKMGRGEWENSWERIIQGRLTTSFRGFHQPREFYSPRYTAENINDPKPDHRPVLLWNPEVQFENGRAVIELFTADNLARYHIFAEGISKKGKICCATSLLTVSIPGK
jgi:hypothetical protein